MITEMLFIIVRILLFKLNVNTILFWSKGFMIGLFNNFFTSCVLLFKQELINNSLFCADGSTRSSLNNVLTILVHPL